MIINLNKFKSIKNITIDFTKIKPGIYFVLNVNEKTPRYKKVKNTYIQDQKGNYVIDHGMDILEKIPRVLKYIGESLYPIARLIVHYTNHLESKSTGIGPVFTHLRVLSNFKRFEYDSIRLHHERLLVRKYLPDLNQASQLTDSQKLIILNSGGKVTPYDLIKPYLLHARDLYKAFKAWEIEDMEYIKKELVPYKLENKTGLIHPNKRDPRLYRNEKNVKKIFGKWLGESVLRFHKKQVDAIKIYNVNYGLFKKLYDPERYEKDLTNSRVSAAKSYVKNREYKLKTSKIYKKLRNEKNQPILL
jgi:hypothetical protein